MLIIKSNQVVTVSSNRVLTCLKQQIHLTCLCMLAVMLLPMKIQCSMMNRKILQSTQLVRQMHENFMTIKKVTTNPSVPSSTRFHKCTLRPSFIRCASARYHPHRFNYERFKSTLSSIEYDDQVVEFSNDDTLSTSDMKPFLLADIGEGIKEVELLQWFVQPGEEVVQFDKICEVQSDKATVEITSRYDGKVGVLCGDIGDMINVGDPLVHFVRDHLDLSECHDDTDPKEMDSTSDIKLNNLDEEADRLHIPTQPEPFERREEVGDNDAGKILATPAVRRLIMEHGIDLRKLKGSGPKGIVLKADVLKSVRANEGHLEVLEVEKNKSNATPLPSVATEQVPILASKEDEVISIRGHHRLMVQSMTRTLQVPHMCYSDEVDMSALKKYRQDLQSFSKRKGIDKLSYLPFAIKAISLALNEFPILNSSIDVDEMTITYHAQHDIGVAIDSPRGLVVPVIRNCQNLSIWEIALELNKLRELTNEGRLGEEHLKCPTFTLSNIGSIGGTYMSPVVLPPQVAIGAMGKIQRLPRFVNEDSLDVEEVHLMSISWGGDHRVIDGASLGRFSNCFKGYMEQPLAFIIN